MGCRMSERLHLTGKLDLAAAPKLRDRLLAQAPGDVDVDFADVTMLGALCLQILVAAARAQAAGGHALHIINCPDAVKAHFAAMGLSPDTLMEDAT